MQTSGFTGPVGWSVGAGLGVAVVGRLTGPEVGGKVVLSLGAAVEMSVGAVVGIVVGYSVGTDVGDMVGPEVVGTEVVGATLG